jgi:ABC-type branched-subunit amino acid transport system substrate-binding protein
MGPTLSGALVLVRPRRALLVAMALVGALALAACGSDGNGGGAAPAGGAAPTKTAAANKPTGDPIKVMTIAAVNWNGPQYPNILETAKLYEKYVNDRGGIAGRPLQVQVCDEQGDPNQLAACGRKAVADKVVSVVGSFTLTGDRIVPILEAKKVTWFGICCSISPAEANSPITFNFGVGPTATGAYASKLIELGCKKPAIVVLDYPGKNLTIQSQTRVFASKGIKVTKTVSVPLASQDYAPQVAQATSGTDCIIGNLAESQWASFLPAFAQSGSTAKLIGAQGNFDEKVAKNFPKVVEGDIVIGTYPDLSDKAFDDYRAAIAQYKPDPSLDYNSLGGLGTWTGYTGFKSIVEKMTGPVTAETFYDAANKTTALDTGGKVPVLDFTKPWKDAPFGYTRIFNTSSTFSKYGPDAKLQVETPGFVDEKATALVAAGGK